MKTKMGKIASKLEEVKEEKTPFEIEIQKLSRKIFFIILGIIIVFSLVGIFKFGLYLSILTAISLAVAAIPEGLPAVVVLSLALAARSMSKKNSLIRRLGAAESIGSIDIICTDKTGTLTKNELNVRKIFFNNKIIDIENVNKNELEILLKCSTLCNNSEIIYDKNGNEKYVGDPTEIALRKTADRFGFVKEDLEKSYKRIDEISFTSERKMMSVVVSHNKDFFVFSKGAPEVLIKKCNRVYINGKILKLSKKVREKILKTNSEFASKGYRILGFAYKKLKKIPKKKEDYEKNLVWLGLQAMEDPPRPEVKDAIKDCLNAGIRVIMLTGDNPLTAKAIAE
jgi:Ca2+-transporting ATPase